MLNIITPMVGEDLYETSSDNSFPKILNDIQGKTILEYSQQYLKTISDGYRNIYILPTATNNLYSIDNIIRRIVGDEAVIVGVERSTAGALCTSLLAAENWDDEDELIITSADQLIDIDCNKILSCFRADNVDVGLISFSSIHPKWSFIKRDDNYKIIEVVEKKAVSNEALAGFTYFRRASLFFELAKLAIMKSRSINNVFYISACVNEAILKGAVISAIKIETNQYYNFYDFNAVSRFNQ
ncbi:hypothetical protein EFZ10_12640 [Tatumella sp. TA1]|nr:hypothetical protein EFZ10_12640 [Tatumella sp. TA1]